VSSWSVSETLPDQTPPIMMRRNVTAANFVGADPPGYFARKFASDKLFAAFQRSRVSYPTSI